METHPRYRRGASQPGLPNRWEGFTGEPQKQGAVREGPSLSSAAWVHCQGPAARPQAGSMGQWGDKAGVVLEACGAHSRLRGRVGWEGSGCGLCEAGGAPGAGSGWCELAILVPASVMGQQGTPPGRPAGMSSGREELPPSHTWPGSHKLAPRITWTPLHCAAWCFPQYCVRQRFPSAIQP